MPEVSRSSPTRRNAPPPGFLIPPRAKRRPISELDMDELLDLQDRNARALASPTASTSTHMLRLSDEQAAIAARLAELDGMKSINTGLQNISITNATPMAVDTPQEKPLSRAQAAKRKAVSRAAAASNADSKGAFSFAEAIQLEQQAVMRDRERQERLEEKRQKKSFPTFNGQALSHKEREARILAFMNQKPTDSDLEDDDEESDDDNPESWFDDEDEDGIKGQNIVYPDAEDLNNVIRIDHSRTVYGMFYEPRDDEV